MLKLRQEVFKPDTKMKSQIFALSGSVYVVNSNLSFVAQTKNYGKKV